MYYNFIKKIREELCLDVLDISNIENIKNQIENEGLLFCPVCNKLHKSEYLCDNCGLDDFEFNDDNELVKCLTQSCDGDILFDITKEKEFIINNLIKDRGFKTDCYLSEVIQIKSITDKEEKISIKTNNVGYTIIYSNKLENIYAEITFEEDNSIKEIAAQTGCAIKTMDIKFLSSFYNVYKTMIK